MKVGDLVKHFLDEAYGIIVSVDGDTYHDDYPYLVRWFDGSSDWFGTDAIEAANESR